MEAAKMSWDEADNKARFIHTSNHTTPSETVHENLVNDPPIMLHSMFEKTDSDIANGYQFLEHKFFKCDSSKLNSGDNKNISLNFICLLCPNREGKISCTKSDSLRHHILNQHETFLKEYDELCKINNKFIRPNMEAFTTEQHQQEQQYMEYNRDGIVHLTSTKGRTSLGFNFHALLEETLHTDITFHFSDGKLHLHRLVLEVASPYLKHIFQTETFHFSEQDVNISLPDFYLSDMQPILPFLYGFAQDSTEVEGELVNCLRLGCVNNGRTMKREVDHWNINIKQEYEADGSATHYNNQEEYGNTMNVDVEPSYFVPSYLDYDECNEEWQESPTIKKRKIKKAKNKLKKMKPVKIKFENTENDNTTADKSSEKKGRKLRYIQVENGWKCTICDKVLDQRHKFRHHADSCFDMDEEGFKCGACKEFFKTISHLKEHLKINEECTSKNSIPTLICEQCSKPHIFYNMRKFQAHSLRHQSVIQCEDCDARYEDYREYVKHIRMVHNDRQFPCTQCCKSFALESVLDKHVLNCHKEFSCHVCGRKYKSNPALKYHMRKHDKGPFNCPKCPRVLKSEHGLAYHMNIHNGIAAFLCNDCGRSFVTKQKMQNHVRAKHTNERPYICDQCGTGFIRSDKMLIHKRRVHTGERPYACEHCEWRGVDSSDLIHHRKKHLKAIIPQREMLS